jgi:hypothetical protein
VTVEEQIADLIVKKLIIVNSDGTVTLSEAMRLLFQTQAKELRSWLADHPTEDRSRDRG